ncbi:protein YhiN [Enterobacter asburiae]|uniref:Protein YhiN n=1 Tax=Enterobacter asburiae TaxID=61645 RepID=A0A376FGQ9_ENTAS|nr:protein YhiN [Enterobacter asburiae]
MQLPKRLVECLQALGQIPDVSLKQLNSREQEMLVETLTNWRVQPNGTEGYRTAEVTLGGVDTNELSSRTMEARNVPGLYFIGEVMDVTGWLGGTTSSGHGQVPGRVLRRWQMSEDNKVVHKALKL